MKKEKIKKLEKKQPNEYCYSVNSEYRKLADEYSRLHDEYEKDYNLYNGNIIERLLFRFKSSYDVLKASEELLRVKADLLSIAEKWVLTNRNAPLKQTIEICKAVFKQP